ncbi:MAG: type II toxin-antitoxin system VapC family toxin [Oscillospiraceae bacterium]|nr:type II toxin-antitoxin system VapC family toxin [Oscillospiraceae bacterium]
MKILIDTHVALWLFNDYENLSQTASDHLHDDENELYISIVSAWEVAIKHSLGKLPTFSGGVKRFLHAIHDNPIQIVGVNSEYIKKVEELPYIHRDPFDRIIISTALCEEMVILTADENIQKYSVPWAW